jgi:hypothetical protein
VTSPSKKKQNKKTKTKAKRAGGLAQVVECLSGKHKTLNSGGGGQGREMTQTMNAHVNK